MDDTTKGIGDEPRRAQPARGASSGTGRGTRARRGASTEPAGLDPDTDMRTREIQAEIAETREELAETVEAIQEKLRPSNIVAESTEAVKTAATERVRHMADSATYTAERFVEDTRQNPWPALLIAAGFTWMLVDRARDGDSYRSSRYRTRTYPSRYRTPTRTGESTPSGDESETAWSGNPEYGGGARAYSGGTHEASGSTWNTGTWNQGRNQGWNQGRSMREMTRNAQSGVQRMLHDNPLLVAAAAVLAGAAVGGALPQTEKENELMGEARDQMIDRAQGAAREAADSVRDVAHAVQDAASQFTAPDTREHGS